MPPFSIALPIADRLRAFAFYGAMGFDRPGEPQADGVPEPLHVAIRDGVRLTLVPTGGFDWVLGDHRTPADSSSASECILNLEVATSSEVDGWLERALQAGGMVHAEAERRPWGYTGMFADPDGHLWQVQAP
ncbi:VOC family protein [Nocardioides ferulae]|uniref:VOC family protein n=1 Tax=Nocardioides ferulae TaxID=2340821 RepID=UPI0013DDD6A5|nr:VOC family protein [Nocardioides ferulae]